MKPVLPKSLRAAQVDLLVQWSLGGLSRGHVPKNTEVNTQWAVRNFNEWQTDYNLRHPDQPCPEDILLSDSSKDLSYWLQKYVLGACKKSDKKYPPKTVYLLFCGLNRHKKEKRWIHSIASTATIPISSYFSTLVIVCSESCMKKVMEASQRLLSQ